MTKLDEAKKIKAEIEELKKKTKILEAKPAKKVTKKAAAKPCLLYTSPSPRDQRGSRMPSSA